MKKKTEPWDPLFLTSRLTGNPRNQDSVALVGGRTRLLMEHHSESKDPTRVLNGFVTKVPW